MSRLRNFDWRQEAANLIEVQDNETWKERKATSFSDWLKSHAEHEGVKISLLWRYLRVGRFAIELETGGWKKVRSPLDIPEGINADSIELLEKINRVATEADFKTLAEDAYHKKIKRAKLLKTWQIYREAMPEGQTARGRGTKRPVLDEKDENKHRLSVRQKVLRLFETADPTSLGYERDVSLQIFNNLSNRKKAHGYDGILVARNQDSIIDLTLIAIEAGDAINETVISNFSNDRLWFIYHANAVVRPISLSQANYPESWGIISADDKVLRIVKQMPANLTPIAFPVSELLLDLIG